MTGEINTAVMVAWQREHPTPPDVHVVDATDVTSMNSAGLAYLITWVKMITPARLTVHAAHRGVLGPMQQMGLDTLLTLTN